MRGQVEALLHLRCIDINGMYDAFTEDALAGFLEDVALATDVVGAEAQEACVTLMTLHAAKGLEFPVVFLLGLEEGLFPQMRSAQDGAALEEERRLCYVGLTRAKEALCLSVARLRSLYGTNRSGTSCHAFCARSQRS